MTRAKVKFTPLGRKIQSSNRLRSSGGLVKQGCKDHGSWDRDAENCPPNLDFNMIEEIANGVEKMILSWSHLDESEQLHKASTLEDGKFAPEKDSLSMMWNLPGANEVSPDSTRSRKKESSEEFCVESETMSDFYLPKQSQTRVEETAATADMSDSVTTEKSVDGSCPGGGMGHAIGKIAKEAVKHSGPMMTDDAQSEKTATCWNLEASKVPEGNTVCMEETSGLSSAGAGNNLGPESTSPSQSLHAKRSRESSQLSGKEVSVSEHPSQTHSLPQTPPISERSVKRMQCQEESSHKKLQLSLSKKTRLSEKATIVPINGASYLEGEDCMKSPSSDCSLLDLTSNSSWNDPLVGSPIRKPSAPPMDGAHIEEFGPWDNDSGHAPVIVSHVTARPDSDLENCTKEKTSFVSFKLWKANKQSESGVEGNGGIGLNGEKSRQSVSQGSTDDHEGKRCGVTAQTIISPQTSDLLRSGDKRTGEMDELQIALLECATEYEIKTIEMKMKLKSIKNLKGEPLSLDPQPNPFSDVSDITSSGANKPIAAALTDPLPEDEVQQLERAKRQVYKLQHQKGCLSRELGDLKKKERQFELQKKSLDAALHKLDRLEWEMTKKEQEVDDWQLRQRLTEAQLQDSVMELQRLTTLGDITDLPMDTASLLSLLPTLRGFVQTLAHKDAGGEYCSDDQSQQDEALCDSTYVDEIVSNLMNEIQALQYELTGIISQNENVCEEPKPRKSAQRQPHVTSKPTTRPSPRLPRDRYQYPRLSAA